MRALPVRRIAFGALCAVLLVGVTGPTALAADSAGERSQVASPDTPLVQIRNSDVRRGELTPVVDLLTAVTRADGGRLPAAEARTLGEAAKDALKKAEAKQRATRAMPFASAPAPGVLLPTAETDPVSDALDDLWDAVDRLLDLLLPGDDAISDATEEEVADEETTDANTGANTDVVDDGATEEIDEILGEILGEAADGADDAVDNAADPTLSWLDDLLTEMGKLTDELSAGDPQVSVVTTQTTPSTTTSSSVASSSITLLTPSPSVPAATSPVVTLPATTPPVPAEVLSAD